jgi:hypothetical protein
VLQGTAMVVGHLISTRAHSLQQRLSQLGTARAYLAERAAQHQRRAAAIEASGDHGEAMRLWIEHRTLLADEARVLRELAAPGAEGAEGAAHPERLAAAHLSAADHRLLTRGNAADLAATSAPGMEELPLRFAGVDEIIPGPGALWSGTHDQITTALDHARAAGLDVHVLSAGDARARWRVQLGKDRVVEIEEHLPRPSDAKRAARRAARRAGPDKSDRPERVADESKHNHNAPPAPPLTNQHDQRRQRISLAGHDEREMLRYAQAIPPIPDTVDVLIHGTIDDFLIKTDHGNTLLGHRSLATYIKKSGLKIKRIRLLACKSGMYPEGSAQHLANKLGVPVMAPSDKLHIFEDGSMVIGPKQDRPTGRWLEFEPKRSRPRLQRTREPAHPSSKERAASRTTSDHGVTGGDSKEYGCGSSAAEESRPISRS